MVVILKITVRPLRLNVSHRRSEIRCMEHGIQFQCELLVKCRPDFKSSLLFWILDDFGVLDASDASPSDCQVEEGLDTCIVVTLNNIHLTGG